MAVKVIQIPDEVVNQLKAYCVMENLGMSAAGGKGFAIIIIGTKDFSADMIALLCAQTLIEGVTSNSWNESHEAPNVVPGPERNQ